MDLPSEAEQAEYEPDGFLSRHPLPLIIDEIQYAPSLFLTGSQMLTLEGFIVRGGFPELHGKPEIDPVGFHRPYVATYLERDLHQSLRVASLRDFERFIRACSLRTSQSLNRADLARDVGISGSTASHGNPWYSASCDASSSPTQKWTEYPTDRETAGLRRLIDELGIG